MPDRVIAIGDIHGYAAALAGLLEAIQPGPDDTLIALGDYVDRGPDTPRVIDQLITLSGRCRLIPLLGNHDEMVLELHEGAQGLDEWLNWGGRETLLAYGCDHPREIPARHIEFLEGGFFEYIGVSFDVYGDQRVDTKGKSSADLVRANLRKLIDHQIAFGGIAVLARDTLPDIKQIYRFFDALGVEHRILAYYRTVGSEQTQRHGLDFDELVGAYKDVFHEWLASERATPVYPIKDFVRFAVQRIMGIDNDRYDPSTSERVFVVDVNGDVSNVSEPEFCYGNLFHSPLREIAESEVRTRSIALSQERMQRFCHQCPYFGNCPGVFVANATSIECEVLNRSGCPVRAVLDHILDVFKRTDLNDFILESYKADDSPTAKEHPALSVA